MLYNIECFDWDHTDESRDELYWPEDETHLPEMNMIHSNQWMYGFMGDAFSERLKEVLNPCASVFYQTKAACLPYMTIHGALPPFFLCLESA